MRKFRTMSDSDFEMGVALSASEWFPQRRDFIELKELARLVLVCGRKQNDLEMILRDARKLPSFMDKITNELFGLDAAAWRKRKRAAI